MLDSPLAYADARDLIALSTGLESTAATREERRQRWLEGFSALVGADAAMWCWGRGNPIDREVTPVATLICGFSPEEWYGMANMGMSPEAVEMYQQPYVPYLKKSELVCLSRSMIWTDERWYSSGLYQKYLQHLGFDNWMIGSRIIGKDTFVCLSLHRRHGRPDFAGREVALMNLSLEGVAWLQAQASESIPPNTFDELSPRRRMVMLCLLDGLSRKQIASHLGITLHTVNDHMKTLFAQFDVNSTTELAAKFLKAR